jgi:hypothetical protein
MRILASTAALRRFDPLKLRPAVGFGIAANADGARISSFDKLLINQ